MRRISGNSYTGSSNGNRKACNISSSGDTSTHHGGGHSDKASGDSHNPSNRGAHTDASSWRLQ